ncbi:MAG: alpha/beta hydrolase [Candidatus Baltobacteraceae bacterium]
MRSDVTGIIRDNQKIVSPNGVSILVPVRINGSTQWLSIRGSDRRNPILLFLHGGPGAPTMPTAWTFQKPWEDYFTVVQWDQRGAGKTYASNSAQALASTMTITQMNSDADAVVRYLRTTFHKNKIFVLANSWGTVLGLTLAQQHPDWLYAYIGVGQIVDMHQSETIGYAFALREARVHGNSNALRQLRSIAPYPGLGPLSLEKISIQRRWVNYYGGLAYGRSSYNFDANAEELSPEYTQHDVDSVDPGGLYSIKHLLGPLGKLDFENITTFKCPILLFEGRHDYVVSFEVSANWFSRVHAPSKRLFWFENSSHLLYEEEPGRFLLHLVNDARPFAADVGDVAPG